MIQHKRIRRQTLFKICARNRRICLFEFPAMRVVVAVAFYLDAVVVVDLEAPCRGEFKKEEEGREEEGEGGRECWKL